MNIRQEYVQINITGSKLTGEKDTALSTPLVLEKAAGMQFKSEIRIKRYIKPGGMLS